MQTPGARLVHDKPVEVFTDGINFEGDFSFAIPKEPTDWEKPRSKIRDLRISEELAQKLRSEGFEVSKVAPSKPWGATFRVNQGELTIAVILAAKCCPTIIQCDVLTFTRAEPEGSLDFEAVAFRWAHLAEVMERIIRRDFQGNAFVWNPLN